MVSRALSDRRRYASILAGSNPILGTIFVILYSLVFVTQPLGESSENDRKFFELLTPIASFIVGSYSRAQVKSGALVWSGPLLRIS